MNRIALGHFALANLWGVGRVLLIVVATSCTVVAQPAVHWPVRPPNLAPSITEEAEEFSNQARESLIRPTLYYSAAMSGDGKWLAIGTSDWTQPGDVILMPRGEQAGRKTSQSRIVRRFPSGVRDVAFSPDSRYLAAAIFTNDVWILDVTNLKTVALWKPQSGAVNNLAFSPDGKRLATAALDKTVSVWDVTFSENSSDSLPLWARFEGHTDSVFTAAFSPDGRTLYSAGRDRQVLIWDVEAKQKIAAWNDLPAVVEHLAISPDGSVVALGLWNGKIEVRQRADGTVLQRLDHLPKDEFTVGRVAFSPDGTQLASVATDGHVKLWVWNDGSLNLSWAAEGGRLWAVQYVAEGQQLLTAGAEGIVRLWERKTGTVVEEVRDKPGLTETAVPMTAAAWSPFTPLFATAHLDNSLRIRRTPGNSAVAEVRDLPEVLRTLAYSPLNMQVAGVGEGPQVYLIDLRGMPDTTAGNSSETKPAWNAPEPIVLTGHSGMVRLIEYAPDGRTLFTTGEDGTIRHWDAMTGVPGPSRNPRQGALRALACSPDGRWLVAAGEAGILFVWDLRGAKLAPLATVPTQQGTVTALAFSPDGKQLASGGEDNSVRLWNLPDYDNVTRFQRLDAAAAMVLSGMSQPPTQLVFSPLGTWIAADGPGESLHLWKTATGEISAARAMSSKLLAIRFDPNGKQLGRLGADSKWHTWDGTPAKIKPVAKLELKDGVRFIAFPPDQTQAVIGTLTATVHLWDLQTGKVTKAHCAEGIADGALSSDGKTLATVGFSGDVALWSLKPLKVIATMKRPEPLQANENEGTAIAISADGSRLATGSWDGMITLWDLPNRKVLQKLPKQELPIEALRFSPDGTQLASCTGNWKEWRTPGTIKIWNVSDEKEIAALPGTRMKIRRIAFSQDGNTLIAGGSQSEILRYEHLGVEWKERPYLPIGMDNSSITFVGAASNMILTASSNGQASLWDVQPRQRRDLLCQFPTPAKAIDAVAASPDGSLLALGTSGGDVQLFVTPGSTEATVGAQLSKRKLTSPGTTNASSPNTKP